MINAVTLLKRRPDLSVAEFQSYWRRQHAALIARLPAIQGYVQSHPLDEEYGGQEPPYDGVAELWARDSQVFREIAASSAYAAVQADEERFLDRTAIALVLTDERILKDGRGAADGVKCIQFFNRKQGLTVEEFQSFWHDDYGKLLGTLPRVDRYVQYPARPGGYARGRHPAHDGFDITWFESRDAWRNAMRSAVFDQCRRERKNFLVAEDCPQILAREYVVIG